MEAERTEWYRPQGRYCNAAVADSVFRSAHVKGCYVSVVADKTQKTNPPILMQQKIIIIRYCLRQKSLRNGSDNLSTIKTTANLE